MSKVHISQIDDSIILMQNTVLAANATIFSNPIHVGGYTHITGFAYSDVASAADGLIVEQAMSLADFPNNLIATSNITKSVFTLPANQLITNNYAIQIVAPFVRIIYVNGAAAQTTFRIYFEARILRGL